MADKKNLAGELLKQDGEATRVAASPPIDAVIRRERLRVRCWAVATAALWIITAVYFLALLWLYLMFVHPILHAYFTTLDIEASDLRPRMMVALTLLRAALVWPVLLFLAALCTTVFTLASRRATLRQIQASLAEINAQLRVVGRID